MPNAFAFNMPYSYGNEHSCDCNTCCTILVWEGGSSKYHNLGILAQGCDIHPLKFSTRDLASSVVGRRVDEPSVGIQQSAGYRKSGG